MKRIIFLSNAHHHIQYVVLLRYITRVKKQTLDSCASASCAWCCAKSGRTCPAHAEKQAVKDATQKLIEGALERKSAPRASKKQKKLKRGTFAEEAFEDIGDTVVVWSLRGYLANPSFSQVCLSNRTSNMRETSVKWSYI